MSDSTVEGTQDGGNINPQDGPGSSPESYREALRDLMGDLVNYLADEGFSAQSFPNATTGSHLPLDKMNQVKAIAEHLAHLANQRAKAHADAAGQDWITPESVDTDRVQVIDDLAAALQEIRNEG